jgi:hypothetical protein
MKAYDELSDKKKKKQKDYYSKLVELNDKFKTKDGRYQKPMLLAQISYLSSMINRADQQPGRDAYNRFEELRSKYEILKTETNDLF